MDYQLGPGPLQVDQNTIDEKIKGDIGIVENGDVATHAIPSGYYVIWKGDLYIAKTDISSGTTLSAASNGNLAVKSNGLGADVAKLNFAVGAYETGWRSKADLNTITSTGRYMIGSAPTNAASSWGILTVTANRDDTILQELEANGRLFIRERRSNEWSEWVEFATKSDITPTRVMTVSTGANIEIDSANCYTIGRFCILNARLRVTGAISAGSSVLLSGLPKALSAQKITVQMNNGDNKAAQITASGNLTDDWAGYTANTGFFVNTVYPIA